GGGGPAGERAEDVQDGRHREDADPAEGLWAGRGREAGAGGARTGGGGAGARGRGRAAAGGEARRGDPAAGARGGSVRTRLHLIEWARSYAQARGPATRRAGRGGAHPTGNAQDRGKWAAASG